MKRIENKLLLIVLLLLGCILFVACDKLPKIVLTPSDKEEYIVTFVYENGLENRDVRVTADDTLTEPSEPTREGYVFLGWFKQGNKYDFSLPVKADMTLKAKWEEAGNLASITYVLFDKTERVEKYVKNTIPEEFNAVKAGYKFLGWYQEVDGVVSSEKFSFKGFKIQSDIKLVSRWERESYKVTFDSDGGSVVNFKIVKGDELVEKPADPTKDGYNFLGWFEKEGENYKENPFNFEGSLVLGDLTLYAKWEIKDDYDQVFENEMNEYFGEINFASFKLPTSYSGISKVSWSSDYPEIINSEGKIVRPYKETVVKLTATLTLATRNATVEFDVTVPGYKLEKATSVASTYVYRNYSKITDEVFDTMDILFCAFTTVNEAGELTGTKFFNNVKDYIIPKAKEKGVYVVLSMAPESSWTTFADPANNLVDTVVNNLAAKITEIGFDGVDIDWERPKSGQETWFTNLANKIDAKLNTMNPNYLLTAAIGAGKWQPPSYDLGNSKQYLDYINMMAYGMEKSEKHYQNALYRVTGKSLVSCSIDESIVIYNNLGVENSKILVGLAFYGIKQTLTDGSWGSGKSVFYDNIVSNYLNNDDYDDYYDMEACVPYIMNKAGTEFISYDNAKSVEEKCNYVRAKNLAGVMAWELGCDTTGTLVGAIKKGLSK